MSSDTIFRERVAEPEEIRETGTVPLEEGVSPAFKVVKPQEDWESDTVKYGLKLFGIEETYKEFPLKLHYGALKNYIAEQLSERGWEHNTKNFHALLNEIEGEIGTGKLETYSRLKKLYEYIQVSKKFKAIREKRDAFLNS